MLIRFAPRARLSTGDARVREVFAAVLGGDVSDDDTFVSLGGDSLSCVEMSVALEEQLGYLPPDWPSTPVGRLGPLPARRGRLRIHRVETAVVLRAVAIILIVGTHTTLWHLTGGAHTLLAIAGFHFARFLIGGHRSAPFAAAARIALPTMAFIAVLVVLTDEFSWAHALLLNSVFGVDDSPRDYWFIQTLSVTLLVTGLMLLARPVRRVERRAPFGVAMAAVGAGLLVRFDVARNWDSDFPFSRPHLVFWVFALGWAAARATTTSRRLVVSALVVLAVHGFFETTSRDVIVTAGILVLTLFRTVPVPLVMNRAIGVVAASTLAIYLTHWQLYPPLLRTTSPVVATTGSIVAGVAVWVVARRARSRISVPPVGRWYARSGGARGLPSRARARTRWGSRTQSRTSWRLKFSGRTDEGTSKAGWARPGRVRVLPGNSGPSGWIGDLSVHAGEPPSPPRVDTW